MKILRDYQHWAIYGNDRFPGILPVLEQHKSTLLVLPTGAGQTVVMSKVANDWTKGNVLCLAHRIELVNQIADTLAGELGYRPSVEQGTRGLDISTLFAAGHVVVGSIQSMITERRARKFRDHPFGLIIIEEAHRATSPSYVKPVDRYRELRPECRVLGVTATPNRADGMALGLVFDSVAFEMNIVDGIDAGWLVDIHQKFAVVEDLDLSKVTLTRNEFGEMDFKQGDLEALLRQEGPLHAMSRPVLSR
jgi:superfamily II DNA or RNA helicase